MQLDRESLMAQRIQFRIEQKNLAQRLDYGDPQDFLTLAHTPVEWVRVRVAAHPAVPDSVLRLLANDPSAEVRMKVAAHQNTPPDVLDALRSSEDPRVRRLAHRSASGNLPWPSWPPQPS